ncbi:BTB and MATH domain-containing protein 38-like [Haliotis cracherodii]|uniref:BTB and MATH domain-containing protein 38-like n=1 Tax=Haliotis cracherodii TaxID=6455 RepID=UPI0039EC7505
MRECFSSPKTKTDLALTVEGKQLYVNKDMLIHVSPVFAVMFTGDFKESSQSEIPLPDKKYGDVVELLQCAFPSTKDHPITRENLDVVLHLADEYGIEFLEQRCERFITNSLKVTGNMSNKDLIHYLFLADAYDLKTATKSCTDVALGKEYGDYAGLNKTEGFEEISLETRFDLVLKRLIFIEQKAKPIASQFSKEMIMKAYDKATKCDCWSQEMYGKERGPPCSSCPQRVRHTFESLSSSVDSLAKCFPSRTQHQYMHGRFGY